MHARNRPPSQRPGSVRPVAQAQGPWLCIAFPRPKGPVRPPRGNATKAGAKGDPKGRPFSGQKMPQNRPILQKSPDFPWCGQRPRGFRGGSGAIPPRPPAALGNPPGEGRLRARLVTSLDSLHRFLQKSVSRRVVELPPKEEMFSPKTPYLSYAFSPARPSFRPQISKTSTRLIPKISQNPRSVAP